MTQNPAFDGKFSNPKTTAIFIGERLVAQVVPLEGTFVVDILVTRREYKKLEHEPVASPDLDILPSSFADIVDYFEAREDTVVFYRLDNEVTLGDDLKARVSRVGDWFKGFFK